jgi:N-acetylhexosamine 1-kinase
MPGLTAYDFGDGARSICSTTLEDESDLSIVKFDLDKFEAFTKGYLSALKGTLTKNELETLGISVYIMTLELASRFLEDYLNGDVYFIIKYPDQNLRRARCQIALSKDIMSKIDKINEIILKYSK